MERKVEQGVASSADYVEKQCRSCGEYWPADEEFFYRQTRNVDGLKGLCIACAKDDSMKRRQRRNCAHTAASAKEPDQSQLAMAALERMIARTAAAGAGIDKPCETP